MKTTLIKEQLNNYLVKQLEFYLPDGYIPDDVILQNALIQALNRCETCFKHILIPGYRTTNNEAIFSHLHMDQYATFLYFLGNSIWETYHEKYLCDKLLNLNRILNGFFLSYKCSMPDIFVLAHPVGSIIGNAIYSNGLYISQNVTINTHLDTSGNPDLQIGQGCFLGAGAKVIGNAPIGNRVSIGVDTLIYNQSIPDDCVCVKNDLGELTIRKREKQYCKAQQIFDLNFYR